MTEKEARDIIQEDIVLKMLGPGYAKDLIACSEDCRDEIIPENPRYAYTLGIMVPQQCQIDDDEKNPDAYPDNTEEENTDFTTQKDEEEKLISGRVENDAQDEQKVSFSHIGLVTCLSMDTEDVCIVLNYGTYRKLSWDESIKQVKVLTGCCKNSIKQAIDSFGKNERLANTLMENQLPDFDKCFVFNEENGTLTLADGLKEPESILCIPNDEYPIEADLVNLLLGDHYKREHHNYECRIQLKEVNGVQEVDGNIKLYWNVFEAKGKKFLKVLMQSVSDGPIYQPEIVVTAPEGKIVSYVEPVTSLDNDEENNINEFVYRKVCNYGKGVNCAIAWDENVQRVYTTFTPSVDVEKFSNEVSDEYNTDVIGASCTLRNLSIWSGWNDEQLIDNLEQFVKGYAQWCKKQDSQKEPQYQNESQTIIDRQEELLKRLEDNVNYLNENEEARKCFKIANTAMLLQMVVARHPEFEKNRDCKIFHEEFDIYDNLEFFHNADYTALMEEPKYRPFQLAFLLMNVKSTFEIEDRYHKDIVDLIWFPTGGGKTEAYLALTALTIVHRRRRGQGTGVSVIMRYTLRMLTSQQFERASYLICALEFLRQKIKNLKLGKNEISIGIYVGSGVTPNKIEDLRAGKFGNFFKNVATRRDENPFPVSYCPWCGSRLVSPDGDSIGYDQRTGSLSCINQRCGYVNGLPIYYIDDQIYNHKPTLLFATVDKFAQLHKKLAQKLLNPNTNDSPDLIIQDELHLLVGALGSIVGLFESVVEALISKNGRVPKIVASTATTRNTKGLIKDLFNREVAVFPPQGLSYDDNYFSHIVPGAKRRHIGMMPLGYTNSNIAEIRLAAFLLLARIKVFKKYLEDRGIDWASDKAVSQLFEPNNELLPELDNYWTDVFYFNSLKDLGRSRSRVSQEVAENFRAHKSLYQIPPSLSSLQSGFDQRVLEFTSRIESSRIKSFLTEAETRIRLGQDNHGHVNVQSGKDLIFASNMISVGIDIARWNLMVMVGQPRSTSEYVQSSSRVARNTYGLVINLLNPLRLREHSLFENYRSFHATYYKSVEPLSVTPLTEATIKHNVLNNIIKIYRDYILEDPGLANDDLVNSIIEEIFDNRFNPDEALKDSLRYEIVNFNENGPFASSLRDITNDAYISIAQIKY